MLDFVTALIGVSFAVLAIAITVGVVSVLVCIATLIKNLPKGIKALRAATESSVYTLALCGQSVAEEARFARLQTMFGKRFLFGVCGIYVSLAKFFAGGASRVLVMQRRSASAFPGKVFKACAAHSRAGISQPALSHPRFSVVMKQ